MIIATRTGNDPHGNRYEEKVIRTDDETFRLEVRSDDAEDCFDADLSLQELWDYMGEAVVPFERTVIEGGLAA